MNSSHRNPLSNLTNTVSSCSSSTPTLKSASKTSSTKNSNAKIANLPKDDFIFTSPNPKTPTLTGDAGRREPGSVYTRRKSSAKPKLKGKAVSVNAGSNRDRGNKSEVVQSKSTVKPPKKKKLKTSSVEDVANYSLPQDFIEKQRAYFAEIDAFELSEEEASADDLE